MAASSCAARFCTWRGGAPCRTGLRYYGKKFPGYPAALKRISSTATGEVLGPHHPYKRGHRQRRGLRSCMPPAPMKDCHPTQSFHVLQQGFEGEQDGVSRSEDGPAALDKKATRFLLFKLIAALASSCYRLSGYVGAGGAGYPDGRATLLQAGQITSGWAAICRCDSGPYHTQRTDSSCARRYRMSRGSCRSRTFKKTTRVPPGCPWLVTGCRTCQRRDSRTRRRAPLIARQHAPTCQGATHWRPAAAAALPTPVDSPSAPSPACPTAHFGRPLTRRERADRWSQQEGNRALRTAVDCCHGKIGLS